MGHMHTTEAPATYDQVRALPIAKQVDLYVALRTQAGTANPATRRTGEGMNPGERAQAILRLAEGV